MIEKGKVIKINNNIAEIEMPSNLNCHKCRACLFVSPDKRIITAYNKVSAKAGDSVKVFIYENKIIAGFLLYILPLIIFFLFLILSNKFFYVKNEPVAVLVGFLGMILSYFIIKIFPGAKKLNNYIIEIVKHRTMEAGKH